MLNDVNWLRITLSTFLAVLWLPVSVHCQLEQLPLLEFLSCCPHPDSLPHQDGDCETDACAVLESGFYKTEEQQFPLPDPFDFPVTTLPSLPAGLTTSIWLNLSQTEAPPELACSWQFSVRAALAPRAPSLPS
jgi:hypothetical protein